MSLYTNSSAKVSINNTLSNAFPIHNGTRQGCPLSPILFLITLEPFFNSLRQNPNIQGICTANKKYKLAAFSNDILLFFTEPLTTLPILVA